MVEQRKGRAALVVLGLWLCSCFDSQPEKPNPDEDGAGEDAAVDPGGETGAIVGCGVVGQSVACVGPGGCTGGQVCQRDGSFGPCDCGAPGDAGGGAAEDAAADPSDAAAAACGVGSACTADRDCAPGFYCIEELSGFILASDLPGGGDRLPVSFFADGVCSPKPLAAWNELGACDVFGPDGQQGCGSCSRCSGIQFDSGLVVGCFEPCTPEPAASGCSREGYSCDLNTRACMQGCASDIECKLIRIDSDGDGRIDMERYDPDSAGVCDSASSRCSRPGTAGAQADDPCHVDDDCEAEGFCYSPDRSFTGNPYLGGSCSKNGCNNAGFECAGDGICAPLRTWDAYPTLGFACRAGCTHGAEPEELQLGPDGHGDGCREGYMCVWAGADGDPSGFCAPGNYNAVAEPNLGAPCTSSADCYSPYGHGLCAALGDGPFVCTVMDCDTPGLPAAICGEQGRCLSLDGDRGTACVPRCDDAGDYPAALGCALARGELPTEISGVCLPCKRASECLAGSTCERGRCVSPDQ